MAWFLGGMTITGAGWSGAGAIHVDFVSQYTDGFLWQLYANRRCIGHTTAPTQRRIYGQIAETDGQTPLTLVRVSADSVLDDVGSLLPKVPANRYQLTWVASSYPADTSRFDITASTEAGGAVDDTNLIGSVPFGGNGAYSFPLPFLTETGDWNYRITPRDDALPVGNAGETTDKTIAALVMPPDVAYDESGNRFSLSASGGVVTVGIRYR